LSNCTCVSANKIETVFAGTAKSFSAKQCGWGRLVVSYYTVKTVSPESESNYDGVAIDNYYRKTIDAR